MEGRGVLVVVPVVAPLVQAKLQAPEPLAKVLTAAWVLKATPMTSKQAVAVVAQVRLVKTLQVILEGTEAMAFPRLSPG
jgi:hypothetical protein